MEEWPTSVLAALAGAAGGIILGLAARLGRFCTLSAIEDGLYGGDFRRMRMWALAIAVAVACVAALSTSGSVDFSRSLYHTLPLNPLAWVVGGLMFGIGMALCGTCGYGTLARVGGGDLRAFFGLLILGISAYMAIAGPTAHLRAALLDPWSLGHTVPHRTLLDLAGASPWVQLMLPGILAAALLLWCLLNRTFRHSRRHVIWGVMAGLAIVSGWIATSYLATDPFDPQPLASHSFTVPLGQTIVYTMTMSTSTLTFGIGSTLGVILGAFIGALRLNEFRWEGADDAREMRRHILGAFLMGTGGVYAGGCTIGQGISAASLLAISAPVVMFSIWLGAWIGLTYLMEGSLWGSLKSIVGR